MIRDVDVERLVDVLTTACAPFLRLLVLRVSGGCGGPRRMAEDWEDRLRQRLARNHPAVCCRFSVADMFDHLFFGHQSLNLVRINDGCLGLPYF